MNKFRPNVLCVYQVGTRATEAERAALTQVLARSRPARVRRLRVLLLRRVGALRGLVLRVLLGLVLRALVLLVLLVLREFVLRELVRGRVRVRRRELVRRRVRVRRKHVVCETDSLLRTCVCGSVAQVVRFAFEHRRDAEICVPRRSERL